MGHSCCVCKTMRSPNFRFPVQNENTIGLWLRFSNVDVRECRHKRLCFVHFAQNCLSAGFSKPTLVPGAVPTLHRKGLKGKQIYVPRSPIEGFRKY